MLQTNIACGPQAESELPQPRTIQPKRQIKILSWRPYEKNTLRGFFDLELPSGLVIRRVMLHERNGARWLGFPASERSSPNGEKQYYAFIEFRSREIGDKFRDQVLTALAEYREQQPKGGA